MLRQIGRYELLEEIGHGGMATVYRSRDTRLDRVVAVKVMHPHLRKTPEARARFVREAKSVARLRHRNILEIYDNSDESSEDAFIVTELLTGPTLKTFREGVAAMPAEVAAACAIEIAEALHVAHEAGIIHRDVKPENVLLHGDSALKLTDFGIAQMVDAQSFTATGQILGSPGHMAPEQIEGGPGDGRVDVFALGTVLYYLATGKLPFAGHNPHQVLRRVVEGRFVEPLRATPTMGAGLANIIEESLAVDPSERFASVAAMRASLADWVASQGIDDPKALLCQYLAKPAATAADHQASAPRRLLARASQALVEKRREDVLAYLNRTLALDEGNREALALLSKLRGHQNQKKLLWVAGALLALVGVGSLAFAMVRWSQAEPRAAVIAPARPSSGRDRDDPRRRPSPRIAPQRDLAPVKVASDTTRAPALGTKASQPRKGPPERVPDVAVRQPETPDPGEQQSRQVCFAPSPRNVELSVDGAAAVPFDRSTRCRELSLGMHRVRVTGAEGCCEPLGTGVDVRAGEGSQLVPLQLRFKASRLYVNLRADGAVPPNGQVLLDDGVTGTTRTFLEVPMETFRRRHGFRVAVPGYAPYQGVVELVAGAQVQATVTLEAVPPS